MRGEGVEGGNVGEAQLTQGVLQDGDAGLGFGRGGGGGGRVRVNCFYNLVEGGGYEGVGEFEEVEFQDGGDDGEFVAGEEVGGDVCGLLRGWSGGGVVDFVAQAVGCSKGHVDEPDCAASFVAVEERIVC